MKSEDEWKNILPPEHYKILREGGTEKPFSGAYNLLFDTGLYSCYACGAPLFRSDTKFDHGCGWPAFTAPVSENAITYTPDNTHGMERIEITCTSCGSHLGHVFDDGPGPSGKRYCVNSGAMQFVPETAIFAAGCFWGVQYKFSQAKGVTHTSVGYTGGTTEDPTYELVCSGKTGHAEAVKVNFDSIRTDYETLVRMFFEIHDPTQLDRQGPDTGTQYRSAIFFFDESQKNIAEKVKKEVQSKYSDPVATEIVPAGSFYMAEEYHQDYLKKQN